MGPSDFELEYNSGRDILIIPEYGRHVQKMIDHARTIEKPEERQQFVERVINLMMQMHPQNRNLDDYRDKLWKHVFRIANYDLEVEAPHGLRPSPESDAKKPEPIGYPITEARFRHYGHNVQTLIKRALDMEAGPKRDGFVKVIGSYMKLAYQTWNKEHYVSDDIIKSDLESLSNGELSLDEETAIDNLASPNRRRKRSNGSYSNNNKGRGRSNRGGKRK